MNAELNPTTVRAPDEVKPDGRSKYAPIVTLRDGVVTLAIRQVERKWLPMSVFGRVVSSKAVRFIGAATVEASLHNGADGLVVVENGKLRTILGVEWPVDFRQKVFDEINRQLHRPASAVTASISGTGAIAIAAICVYLIIGAIAGPKAVAQAPVTAPSVAAPVLSANEADAMSSSVFAQKALESDGSLSPAAAAAQAKSLVVRPVPPGGKGIIVWSDPLCPHCRDFEQKVLSKLAPNIGVTVIPVAFKHGARPLVANVLCSAEPGLTARRWTGLMAEQPNVDLGEQCATGAGDADKNSALFARAGLTETPTIMKASGAVYSGDKGSVEGLVSWLALQ